MQSRAPRPARAESPVDGVLRSPGRPLDTATRASMETRFARDFSRVRVHTDERAAESAHALNALAYTAGSHVVFGSGTPTPQLLAHELTHVVQQRGGAAPGDAASEAEADAIARGSRADSITQSRAPGIACAPAPPVPAAVPAPPPVTGVLNYSETRLPGGMVRMFAEGLVGDAIPRWGLEKKYPDPGKVGLPGYDRWHLAGPNATGTEQGISYAPKNFNISETARIENDLRAIRSEARLQNVEVYFEFVADTRVIGTHEGVEIRVLDRVTWKIEIRMPGSEEFVVAVQKTGAPSHIPGTAALRTAAAPAGPAPAPAPAPEPAAAPRAAAPETAAPAPRPAAAPEAVVAPEGVAPEAAAARGAAAGSRASRVVGAAGGVLGVFAPMVMSWLHGKAVQNRIEQQAQTQGFVPPNAPSGEGFLYDLGAWLLDPTNEADKSVPLGNRFVLSVWRQRVREAANAKQPGETLAFTWYFGKCEFDWLGTQKIEEREVIYRKEADGSWVVQSGEAFGTPNFNKVISLDVPDSEIDAVISQDPCASWA